MLIEIFCCTILCFSFPVTGNHVPQPDDKIEDKDVIQNVLKRLTSLESKYRQQADENIQLQNSVGDLHSKYSALQNENQQLQNQINALQSRGQARDRIIESLRQHMSVLVKHDQERSKDIQYLLNYIRKAEKQEDEVRSRQEDKDAKMIHENSIPKSVARTVRQKQRIQSEVKVAFFSTLMHYLTHLGINQNIVFDRVITNVGNAYNNHAGDFRAPVAGTYVFSVTLLAYDTHTTHNTLVKNGTAVANMYVRGTESPYASSCMTVILELKQGEDVAIKNVDQNGYLHGTYCTFSGFLLFQDYSNTVVVGK